MRWEGSEDLSHRFILVSSANATGYRNPPVALVLLLDFSVGYIIF